MTTVLIVLIEKISNVDLASRPSPCYLNIFNII